MPLPPFRWSGFGTDLTTLAPVRTRLAEWVRISGWAEDVVQDIVLATYEALVNALEHAYPGGKALADLAVDLTAVVLADGALAVSVQDYGQWRVPPADPGFRGRGVRMIQALADRTEVTRGTRGSTVQMWWLPPVSSGH